MVADVVVFVGVSLYSIAPSSPASSCVLVNVACWVSEMKFLTVERSDAFTATASVYIVKHEQAGHGD